MKHTFYSLLPLFLLLDLVIPFLLATTCPGYGAGTLGGELTQQVAPDLKAQIT